MSYKQFFSHVQVVGFLSTSTMDCKVNCVYHPLTNNINMLYKQYEEFEEDKFLRSWSRSKECWTTSFPVNTYLSRVIMLVWVLLWSLSYSEQINKLFLFLQIVVR